MKRNWEIFIAGFGLIASGISLYILINPDDDNVRLYAGILLVLFLIYFIIRFLFFLYLRWQEKISVTAYAKWSEAPKKYHIDGVLAGMRKHEDLQIVARTAFRWLCGSEVQQKEDYSTFIREKEIVQQRITEVISNKNKLTIITFILQCPKIEMAWWEGQPRKIERNHEQFNLAVKNFIEFKRSLQDKREQDRLLLEITKSPVSNSMIRIISPNGEKRVRYLLVDLGDPTFQDEDKILIKPFVVFESRKNDINHYSSKFTKYLASKPGCDQCTHACAGKQLAELS